ncbi:hypothetical protein P171DRAFT_519138 [Karstenula rhodostoma CBS 690.94]|uniref:Peptidase S1 domain-containing protein n=1 Tax=Karstenula rhodostoma CBS 690.94 TaxID=1392251 RepID=A0A9P4PM87_9PLEO|nr:hypothetical protein P171DRAFT_519138 [Karstenula rhodostoma CBS 690.94]
MKLVAYQIPLLALASLPSTFALPVLERDGPYKHPIARVHISSALTNAPGITPNLHILDKADLLSEGTIVSGSVGPNPIPTATRPQKRSVIGAESRYLQTKTGNPWDYVGRLEWGVGNDGYRCSGALVGPRHLATARHCFNTTNTAITYTFRPNYDQGARGYTAGQVTNILYVSGSLTDTCSYGDDWAVMILNQRLGDKYGYFGAKQFAGTTATFWHEGYPFDLGGSERPYLEQSISGKSASQCNSGTTGPILTKADASDGQSGGPLWLLPEADGVRYTYGVLSSGSATDTLFAGRTAFVVLKLSSSRTKQYPLTVEVDNIKV